jgi:hypothetical protein
MTSKNSAVSSEVTVVLLWLSYEIGLYHFFIIISWKEIDDDISFQLLYLMCVSLPGVTYLLSPVVDGLIDMSLGIE